MQCLRQKRGKVRLRDATPQGALRAADGDQTRKQVRFEVLDRVRATVGELALRQAPDPFIRVQLRCVGGEVLETQPWEVSAQRTEGWALVDVSTIPQDDHGTAQVTQELSEEGTDLRLPNVVEMQAEVESEPAALRTDRDSRDHGDPIVALPEPHDRGLTARGPGSADAGDEQEAGFVYEDEVGTQPRGVFFTRGQSFRFQRAIASSSRWRARLSGFCAVQPSWCRRRPT